MPLAILLLMWLVGPISSMCINPARAFGPAFVTGYAQLSALGCQDAVLTMQGLGCVHSCCPPRVTERIITRNSSKDLEAGTGVDQPLEAHPE